MTKIKQILLVLGVLSLVVVAMPNLGVVALISVIGMPLAIIYWSIPAVFLIALIAYLIFRSLGLSGKSGAVASIILTLLALAIPPFLLNIPIHQKAASLAAGDLDKLELPIAATSIGSRERFRFSKDTTPCDGFCLHALLTGTAKRFLVINTKAPYGEISSNDDVIAFQLEKRDTCPAFKFKSGAHTLKFPVKRTDTTRTADAVETLKLRASDGTCLTSHTTKLQDADIVISRGNITNGVRHRSPKGFSFFTKTVTADRISVHQRNNNREFEEIYRKTKVRYRPFGWLLIPVVEMKSGLNVQIGWWRKAGTINVQSRYDDPYEWSTFLTQKLGFDLKLEGEDTKTKTLNKLKRLLDEGMPPSSADWALFSQYFDRINIGHNAKMSSEDFELGLRVLENDRFPVPPRTYNLVRYAKRHSDDAKLTHLAGLFVSRLNGNVSWHENLGADPKDQIRDLSFGVNALPDNALRPYKDAMLELATRTDVQNHGYIALTRLGVFGDDAVPALLSLIKVGISGGDKKSLRKNQFQHPLLGGLQGLCLAGPNAQTALPEMRRLVAEHRIPDRGSLGRLLFTTLLRLGEDRELVRSLFMAAAHNKANATDKHFDLLARSAMKDKPPCHY